MMSRIGKQRNKKTAYRKINNHFNKLTAERCTLNAEHGFTFIELLVVTLIIGILSALAVPRLNSFFEKFRLENYCNRFIQMTQAAHELSMLEGRTYRISIQREPASFHLEALSQEEPVVVGKIQYLPKNYSIYSTQNYIFFTPEGETTESQISFKNATDLKRTLEISRDGKFLE